jgi:cell division septum initiation protein DivIVA
VRPSPSAATDLLVLIDRLHDLVRGGKKVSLSQQVRVDKGEISDTLERMRSTIPSEIKEARAIVQERQQMLAEAKREADRIVSEAPAREKQLASQHELVRHAQRAAQEIIEDARARERELRRGAEDYADELLTTLELNLTKVIAAVQRGRERLRRPDEPAERG